MNRFRKMCHYFGGRLVSIAGPALLVVLLWNFSGLEHELLASGTGGNGTQSNKFTFNPDEQKLITKASGNTSLALVRVTPCDKCGGGRAFTFSVNELNRDSIEFTIQNETAQVDDVFIISASTVAVIGSVSGTVRAVNVVDLAKAAVIDVFYCSFPIVSPDGQFVAYVKLAPRGSSPAEWSNQYRLYDLSATPSQNRGRLTNETFIGESSQFEDSIEVGTNVYPETAANGSSSPHTLASNGMFWLDRKKLAFVDRWNKENALVVIDVGSGLRNARVGTVTLKTLEIINPSVCSDAVSNPQNLIYVTDMRQSEDGGTLRLTFAPECLLSSTRDEAYSDLVWSPTKR